MDTTVDGLLARAAGGDADAFAEWYDATCVPAYRLARCLAPDAADDVLRRAYLEAWRTAPGFASTARRSLPWLLALVRGCARDRHRAAGPARPSRTSSAVA